MWPLWVSKKNTQKCYKGAFLNLQMAFGGPERPHATSSCLRSCFQSHLEDLWIQLTVGFDIHRTYGNRLPLCGYQGPTMIAALDSQSFTSYLSNLYPQLKCKMVSHQLWFTKHLKVNFYSILYQCIINIIPSTFSTKGL